MIHGFIIGSLENGIYILRGTGVCVLMNLCAERWSVSTQLHYYFFSFNLKFLTKLNLFGFSKTLIPDDNRWQCSSPLGANEPLPTDYFIRESFYKNIK